MLNLYPKISVITPSFNQAEFLERTIISVLNQDYPNLEFIIIDGGSTDGSLEIIKKYSKYLNYWISEKDGGQVNAINKGIKKSSGEWLAWQNSDDIYYPNCFRSLVKKIQKYPNFDFYIGNINLIDRYDRVIRDVRYVDPSYYSMLAEGMVMTNQAAFWSVKVHQKIGLLNENYDCAFDYDWFLKLSKNFKGKSTNELYGGYRYHDATKTSNLTNKFHEENKIILADHNKFIKRIRIFFAFRRCLLFFLNGHSDYLLRGILLKLKIIKEMK
jgi:glycosyltransferase involved in cell wall biosynthesis